METKSQVSKTHPEYDAMAAKWQRCRDTVAGNDAVKAAVKDRVLATNKAFEAGKIKVNAKACPTIARCLEQQAYDDNGEPDKTTGFDHMNEAFSYVVAYEFPIIKPMSRIKISGA